MTFSQLELDPAILKALNSKGYTEPTPIQEQAIPVVLQNKDLLGVAQTGTGKTAAFALPILHKLAHQKRGGIKALIVTPTRELAIQIEENLQLYSAHLSVRSTTIFGGVKQNAQVDALRKGVDILVATPGRLNDLIGQGFITLNKIEYFVLDEADRMLDMGFIHDIKKILQLLPERRQSLFFSATMPKSILQLSRQILNQPVKVEVAPASTAAETVAQFVYYTNKPIKKDLLLHILKEHNMDHVLLFTRTKHGADKLARILSKAKIPSAAIHGNKSQNQRQKALEMFKQRKLAVLVATDIAARGIDIDKLSFVINYDIPNEPETYVHRIGRVGRAGELGQAYSLSEPEENTYIKSIEKLIRQSITVLDDHPFPQTDQPMSAAEKKEFEREKQRRKQEFFKNRKNTRGRR